MTTSVIISFFDSIPIWVMLLPLIIASIILLAVVFERWFFYRSLKGDFSAVLDKILDSLSKNHFGNAVKICEENSQFMPYFEPILSIVEQWEETHDREFLIRHSVEGYLVEVDRWGGVVSTIATVSPMMGLLGTVTGMMKSFSGLSQLGPKARDVLALGITEALITTAFGLLVAIPALMFYNYMVSKSGVVVRDLEYIASSFMSVDHSKKKNDEI